MPKSVKLADIAKMTGVSSVTVSKALSGKKGVSEEMREKIRQKADELGYKQPSVLRRMYQNRTYTIGVLIAERYLDKQESFYWKMYQELTDRAKQKGSITALEIVSGKQEEMKVRPRLITEKMVDGVILIGTMRTDYIAEILDHTEIPLVCLDSMDRDLNLDCVVTNNYFGMYRMTKYLLDHGHRKIDFVGTIGSTESITDRYFGYMKAMAEYGITPDRNQIVKDREEADGLTEDYEIQLPSRSEMPTAFACNCDRTAARVIGRLEKAGYAVPKDISVVGFDNYLYPGLCDVAITTYEVDMHEMAGRALYILRKKIEKEYYKKGVATIEGHLVEQESVRTLPVSAGRPVHRN